METEREKYRKVWEKQLPDISDEWSHWWFQADNYCVGVVPGSDLLAALDIIEDNFLKYQRITVSTAKVVDGDLVRKNGYRNVVIAKEI